MNVTAEIDDVKGGRDMTVRVKDKPSAERPVRARDADDARFRRFVHVLDEGGLARWPMLVRAASSAFIGGSRCAVRIDLCCSGSHPTGSAEHRREANREAQRPPSGDASHSPTPLQRNPVALIEVAGQLGAHLPVLDREFRGPRKKPKARVAEFTVNATAHRCNRVTSHTPRSFMYVRKFVAWTTRGLFG
jgi:hypothetical protein